MKHGRREYPWARAYRYASSGVGGIVGLSWTQARAALFDYSDPVHVNDVVIVVDGDGGATDRINTLVLGRLDCALFNAGKAGFEERLRAR